MLVAHAVNMLYIYDVYAIIRKDQKNDKKIYRQIALHSVDKNQSEIILLDTTQFSYILVIFMCSKMFSRKSYMNTEITLNLF